MITDYDFPNCLHNPVLQSARNSLVVKPPGISHIAQIQSHEFRRPVASILGFMEYFRIYNYLANKENLKIMEVATGELDENRNIVQVVGK
ncbi:hypothetical protein A0256_15430 [Mucilaginibacter sp. PAMC 26640]|nr:hypothetical protein A0256_15430 [Mucilaginibacter sp. PAMC 26640]